MACSSPEALFRRNLPGSHGVASLIYDKPGFYQPALIRTEIQTSQGGFLCPKFLSHYVNLTCADGQHIETLGKSIFTNH